MSDVSEGVKGACGLEVTADAREVDVICCNRRFDRITPQRLLAAEKARLGSTDSTVIMGESLYLRCPKCNTLHGMSSGDVYQAVEDSEAIKQDRRGNKIRQWAAFHEGAWRRPTDSADVDPRLTETRRKEVGTTLVCLGSGNKKCDFAFASLNTPEAPEDYRRIYAGRYRDLIHADKPTQHREFMLDFLPAEQRRIAKRELPQFPCFVVYRLQLNKELFNEFLMELEIDFLDDPDAGEIAQEMLDRTALDLVLEGRCPKCNTLQVLTGADRADLLQRWINIVKNRPKDLTTHHTIMVQS